MRIYKIVDVAKLGHFLYFEINYTNKAWFCNEPECSFLGSRKELKKHKESNCEWDNA